jgi:exodeoxyribonuclease VII large subunit
MNQRFTLLELNKNIQEKINTSFSEHLWVIGEISELKVNRNGHCYLELVEKDAVTDHIIAKSRATIWSFTYRMLRPYFASITGHELTPGIKLLVKAKVEFHELYGLSLNITDIDPNYTLGDLAQKRKEIIQRLENDGVLNLNKELNFPTVPQKIAIISSDTAAGYQDFMNQLKNNNHGFKFYSKLYQSLMQGIQSEDSIIHALEEIYRHEDFFDVVVIIRGGGSQADLSCFDSYMLAANIAQFPLPVLTGIGHEKDESIADLVAYQKLKTPTAVAEYIIERTAKFEETIMDLKDDIADIFFEEIQTQKNKISQLGSITIPSVKNNLNNQKYKLNLQNEKLRANVSIYTNQKKMLLHELMKQLPKRSNMVFLRNSELLIAFKNKLTINSTFLVKKEKLALNNYDIKHNLLDPNNILKRGYSITYHNGKVLKDSRKVKSEDEIKTKLFEGSIRSKVKEKTNKEKK